MREKLFPCMVREVCRRHIEECAGAALAFAVHLVCCACCGCQYASCKERIGVKVQSEFNCVVKLTVKPGAAASDNASAIRNSAVISV